MRIRKEKKKRTNFVLLHSPIFGLVLGIIDIYNIVVPSCKDVVLKKKKKILPFSFLHHGLRPSSMCILWPEDIWSGKLAICPLGTFYFCPPYLQSSRNLQISFIQRGYSVSWTLQVWTLSKKIYINCSIGTIFKHAFYSWPEAQKTSTI